MATSHQFTKYSIVAIVTTLLTIAMTVFAAPFTPGQTLDPNCNPGDTLAGGAAQDCYVQSDNLYIADGTLLGDRMINLDTYELASSGTGSINFNSTLSDGNEGFLQVSNDVLGLEAAGAFPIGGGIKGAGFFVQEGSLLAGGILNRILVGNFSGVVGSGYTNGFNIGAGDLGGSQPESHIEGKIDANPGSPTEGSSELTIRSTGRNGGSSNIEIDSVEDDPAGTPTLELEVRNTTIGYQMELSMDGVRMENYMLPWTDGTANQVLQTDGAGQLSWASLGGGGGADTNFSTTDLTFTADRTHNLDGFGIDIQNGNFGIIASSAFLNAVIPGGFPYYGPYHSNGTALAVNGVRDSTIFGGGIEATGAVTDFATSAESFYRLKSDGVQIGRIESGGVGAAEIILDDDGMDLNLGTIGKHLNMQNLSTYPDDAAADAGGLVPGDVYKTATGELRIKL